MTSSHPDKAQLEANDLMQKMNLTPKGKVQLLPCDGGLRFTVTYSQPHNFGHKSAVVRSYLLDEGPYRLPLRIDMTISLDAPGFCLMLGETGKIHFCSTWNDNGRIVDIAEAPAKYKPAFFANHMPLNTPTEITVIYNLKSMRILINGQQRYNSVKERYMRHPDFSALNAAGFPLRLTCHKRTEATIHAFSVTESHVDFPLEPAAATPDVITTNIALRPGDKPSYENIIAACGGKPTFDAVIANLPDEIRAKVVEMDATLRAYKPIKFRRSIERNGNKITYVASDEGVSYMIIPSRDMLVHTLEWYLLFNSKENWGKRKQDNLVQTLEKLAEEDATFAERMFSYLKDCTGCYGPGCGGRSAYTFQGKTRQSCHGKIEFKMAISEFDDVLRFIRAIR